MKTITLIYGADDSSKAALNEIEYIRNKYSDIILTHKIKIITQIDTEYREIDATIHKYPTLFFIDDLKVEKIEGYNLENLNNNYWEYFLENFELRNSQPFDSWTWNENNWIWEPPIPNLNKYPTNYKWDEDNQSWVPKYTTSKENINEN